MRRYGISSKIKLKLVLYIRGMVLVKNNKVELVTEKVLILVQKILLNLFKIILVYFFIIKQGKNIFYI